MCKRRAGKSRPEGRTEKYESVQSTEYRYGHLDVMGMDRSEKGDLPEHVANAARVRYRVLVKSQSRAACSVTKGLLLKMSSRGPNSRNRGLKMEMGRQS